MIYQGTTERINESSIYIYSINPTTTVKKHWTLTLMHRCLCWRTESMTERILTERGLSSSGNDVRSISIWAAE
jgi:hypothetical protein